MLARREHGREELKQKLIRKGCSAAVADAVTAALAAEHLLSEDRFVEALVRVRRSRGYGPLRIRHELEQKGIERGLIGRALDVGEREWVEDLRRVRRKRFGGKRAGSPAEQARQTRFLQYRGFTSEQIRKVLRDEDE
jgi:regulatory protein